MLNRWSSKQKQNPRTSPEIFKIHVLLPRFKKKNYATRYVYMYLFMYMYMYDIYIYAYIYIYIYIYIYTYTYIVIYYIYYMHIYLPYFHTYTCICIYTLHVHIKYMFIYDNLCHNISSPMLFMTKSLTSLIDLFPLFDL